jgi:hypothetical protein
MMTIRECGKMLQSIWLAFSSVNGEVDYFGSFNAIGAKATPAHRKRQLFTWFVRIMAN